MRERSHPWKWPLSVALAVSLCWCMVLFVPESWLDIGGDKMRRQQELGRQEPPSWLVLSVPPEILVETSPPPEHEPESLAEKLPLQDPRWWTEGWRVVTTDAVGQDLQTSAGPQDSVAVFLEQLGVGADLLTMVRPDSILAARLILLRRENQFKFEELKPYYQAVTRSRDWADVLSRAADMHGDFLQQEIMVPD